MRALRKYRIGLVVGLLTACAAVGIWAWPRHPRDVRWVERVSGITIPMSISGLRIEYPREFCIAGRMTLPRAEVDSFLKANRFTPPIRVSSECGVGNQPGGVHQPGISHAVGTDYRGAPRLSTGNLLTILQSRPSGLWSCFLTCMEPLPHEFQI